MAELIQCHWCKCFSQTARLALRAELALDTLTGFPSTKNTNDNDYHLMGQPTFVFLFCKVGTKKNRRRIACGWLSHPERSGLAAAAGVALGISLGIFIVCRRFFGGTGFTAGSGALGGPAALRCDLALLLRVHGSETAFAGVAALFVAFVAGCHDDLLV
jgi:hypothetical protein